MQRMKSFSLGTLAVGAALIVGQIFAMAPAGAQMAPPPAGPCAQGRFGKALNLTAEQKAQAKAIFKATREQVKQVLTPEQQQGLRAYFAKERGAIFQSLNLTPAQQEQVKGIREAAKAQVQQVKANTSLSPDQQKAQIRELRKGAHQQIMQVLTPAQKTALKGAVRNEIRMHHPIRAAFKSINLTADQQAQMKAIRTKAMADFRAILTPEQAQKLDSFMKAHHRAA